MRNFITAQARSRRIGTVLSAGLVVLAAHWASPAAAEGVVYSTYLGGAGHPDSGDKDVGNDIAVDAAGNTYVTGGTNSIGRWDSDAYVAKFDPSGLLIYETYLDDNGGDDVGNGIAVDAAGNAYVTGSLADKGVFVAQLDAAGSVLYFVTFGAFLGLDVGTDIAVDAAGNAYVTGTTLLGYRFPTTPGAFQPTYGGGNWDAFVTKLDPQGLIVYSTFLGGSGEEDGFGIEVDGSGNAYVVGGTASADFPTTAGAFQPAFGGGKDIFVTVLDATGSAAIYSTYLGGAGAEQANDIALDAAGNAYLTGLTAAIGENNFPVVNPFKSTYSGGVSDSIYAKLDSSGGLVYSSYLSGHLGKYAGDVGTDIAVDAAGNVYVTGSTIASPDSTYFPGSPGFPVVNAWQTDRAGVTDAFVTMVSPEGNSLVYSSYLGGRYSDDGFGIALDPNGGVYVIGTTGSDDFPTTPGAYQETYGGGDCDVSGCADTFITKIW